MKFTRLIAFIMVAATLMLSLTGCASAYKNPEKYISVPTLKDIKLTQTAIDEKVAEAILEIRESLEKQYFDEVKDGETAKKGDMLVLTYTATLANKELDPASFNILKGEKLELIIGAAETNNKQFPTAYNKDGKKADSFEDQLLGAKKGDELTIKGIFADSFSTQLLKNEEVTYTVKVDAVKRITVSDKHTLSISFAPVNPDVKDEMDAIKDIIVTLDKTETKEEQTDKHDDHDHTTTATTTSAPSSSTTPTEKKFTDLFKPGTTSSMGFTEKDGKITFSSPTTAISTIYDYADLDTSLFLGRNLYDKFAYALTVTEEMVKAHKEYEKYKGRDIYFTFEISKATSLPEWNDETVSTYTSKEYEKVADYEVELKKNAVQTLGFEAIVDAATVISYPEKELKEYYDSAVESNVISALQSADKNFTSISNYTQEQIDKLISKEKYESIWKASIVEAKEHLKERLVIEYLIDLFGVKVTKSEYKAKLKDEYNTNFVYYYYYYFGSSFSISQLESMFGKDYWQLQFEYAELIEHIKADVFTIVEK